MKLSAEQRRALSEPLITIDSHQDIPDFVFAELEELKLGFWNEDDVWVVTDEGKNVLAADPPEEVETISTPEPEELPPPSLPTVPEAPKPKRRSWLSAAMHQTPDEE